MTQAPSPSPAPDSSQADTDRPAISAFVIARNEAHRMGATLDSLEGLVDEIIVVDSGSTDGTQELARSKGAIVIENEWPGYGPQKRFAEEQCKHDWLLNLDADEVLSEAFRSQLRALFPAGGPVPTENVGYKFRIRDCLPGEATARTFAHTTKAVRLYDKRYGRYVDSPVHDRVKFADRSASIGAIKAPVWHHSVVSLGQFVEKLNKYSTMQAEDMEARGRYPKFITLRLLFEFPLSFLKYYILRGDIMRGRSGFIHSVAYGFHRFSRIAKVFESHQARKRGVKPPKG